MTTVPSAGDDPARAPIVSTAFPDGTLRIGPVDGGASADPAASPAAAVPATAASAGDGGAAGDPPQADANPAIGAMPWPGTADGRDRLAAHAAVFAAWGARLPDGSSDPCLDALDQGLRCQNMVGAWQSVLDIDRPAVLELRDGADSAWVALLGVHGDRAEVALDGVRRRVAADSVARHWHGRFTVLWRVPEGYRVPFGLGARGDVVTVLRTQLARHVSVPPALNASDFDAGLDAALRQWQRGRGLDDDGIAGAMTWLHLGDDAATTPRLRGPAGGH